MGNLPISIKGKNSRDSYSYVKCHEFGKVWGSSMEYIVNNEGNKQDNERTLLSLIDEGFEASHTTTEFVKTWWGTKFKCSSRVFTK